jgi:hypothetical protein
LFQNLQARKARQAKIQHHGVEVVGPPQEQGRLAIAGLLDDKAGFRQRRGQATGDLRIIFDEQDANGGSPLTDVSA